MCMSTVEYYYSLCPLILPFSYLLYQWMFIWMEHSKNVNFSTFKVLKHKCFMLFLLTLISYHTLKKFRNPCLYERQIFLNDSQLNYCPEIEYKNQAFKLQIWKMWSNILRQVNEWFCLERNNGAFRLFSDGT